MTVYNSEGWVEDLPSLNPGRNSHGCGHFINTDNQVVRQHNNIIAFCVHDDHIHHQIQVYLVAGGYTGSLVVDSTELLTDGASSWTEAGPLPRAMSLLQAVSINNMVISTGE